MLTLVCRVIIKLTLSPFRTTCLKYPANEMQIAYIYTDMDDEY